MKRHYYLILSLVVLLCSQTTYSQICNQIGEIVPFETFAPACDLNYAINIFGNGQLLPNVELPPEYQIGDIIKFGGLTFPSENSFVCEFTGETVTYIQLACLEPAACVEPLLAETFEAVDCIALYDPVCGCDGQTYGNVCEAQSAGITSFVAGECGNNGVFCGAEEAWAIPWLQSYINNPCYPIIYSFEFNGQTVVYITATPECQASDVPSVLFNCQGEEICSSGNIFTPANEQCSNLTAFLIPENIVWFDDPACCDPIDSVCGVAEIWDLEWLNELTDNADGCSLMSLQQFEYNGATYFQGVPNFGSATCPTDLPTIFYDCEGNTFCTAGFGGTNCPPNLFEAANGGFTVWKYEPEPCICPAVFEPVCGVDGVTYGNACQAACEGVAIAYDGFCEPPLVCGVEDIWELEWLDELIATSDPCDVYQIHQFVYEGNFYFETSPQIPNGNSNCPIDNSYIFYDCEGNIVCTEGSELGSDCDFSNGTTGYQLVWSYQDPNDCGNMPLFSFNVTGQIGTLDFPTTTGGNLYCFTDNIFTDNICGWLWDFGNGTTSTEADPCDIYLGYVENGEPITTPYNVCLSVTECGSGIVSTCCQEIYSFPPDDNENCICPSVALPVCGIDGVTYDNACEAACAGVAVLYNGSCEEPNDLNMCEVDIKMFLQGALLNTTDGLMRDDLRNNNMLPLTEPYASSPYFTHVGGGGEMTTPAVFNVSGQNAITDWVFLELRDAANNLVKTRSALLQRDGDVVEVDGVSPVNFDVSDGNYYVCVRHRNHLGTMTNNLMNISSNTMTSVDFTNINTYGTNAQMAWDNNTNALWAGHTNNTGAISFQGFNNNINGLFFEVLTAPNNTNNVTNYIYNGYNEGDINMDGSTIYQGTNSDANHIFFTTIQHPQNENYIANFTIYQQMP